MDHANDPDVEFEAAPSGAASEPPDPSDADSPEAFVRAVRSTLAHDPVAAGDYVGGLLRVVREHADARAAAAETLDSLGRRRPEEFAVWTDDLAAVADADDPAVAVPALRALAHLGRTCPRRARAGIDAARSQLNARDPDLRGTALAVVGAVGATEPESVHGLDREVRAGLLDAPPAVRVSAASAAGKLLAADPTEFPLTATSLFDALEDDHEVVAEYATVALVHFADERPRQVPEKRLAIETLATTDDTDLGIEEGATKDALVSLLGVTFDLDV